MQTLNLDGWEVKIAKAAIGGWLAIATREGIELREKAESFKRVLHDIEIAIRVEMDNPWWEHARCRECNEPLVGREDTVCGHCLDVADGGEPQWRPGVIRSPREKKK